MCRISRLELAVNAVLFQFLQVRQLSLLHHWIDQIPGSAVETNDIDGRFSVLVESKQCARERYEYQTRQKRFLHRELTYTCWWDLSRKIEPAKAGQTLPYLIRNLSNWIPTGAEFPNRSVNS